MRPVLMGAGTSEDSPVSMLVSPAVVVRSMSSSRRDCVTSSTSTAESDLRRWRTEVWLALRLEALSPPVSDSMPPLDLRLFDLPYLNGEYMHSSNCLGFAPLVFALLFKNFMSPSIRYEFAVQYAVTLGNLSLSSIPSLAASLLAVGSFILVNCE